MSSSKWIKYQDLSNRLVLFWYINFFSFYVSLNWSMRVLLVKLISSILILYYSYVCILSVFWPYISLPLSPTLRFLRPTLHWRRCSASQSAPWNSPPRKYGSTASATGSPPMATPAKRWKGMTVVLYLEYSTCLPFLLFGVAYLQLDLV